MISKSLTGPIGLFVRFSTLQEYGVDKVFVLENGNTDSSQRNIVYLIQAKRPHMCKPQLVCILPFICAETNVVPFPSQLFAINLLLYIEAHTRIFILYEHVLVAFSA